MFNRRLAIALLSVGLSGAVCAATKGEHTHQHTLKEQSKDLVSTGVSTPAKSIDGRSVSAKEPVMLAEGKAGMEMSNGQVKRINKGSKKITIKHGEIKSLDMPPMTMVFRVADDAMLEAVKKGDQVMFHVEDKNGAMVITEIKPVQQ